MEYIHQLKRVTCPLEEGSEARQFTEQQLRTQICKKLVDYKRQDYAHGYQGFNKKVNCMLQL